MVTAPYGQGVSQEGWIDFYKETGIPVVIDGAGAFESVCENSKDRIGTIPVVLSLHATKTFSTGEGGLILCRDQSFLERVLGALNFGFLGVRESSMANTNGKMSEYHAAVGLAELDGWNQKALALSQVTKAYSLKSLAAGIADRIVTAPRISSSYVLFIAQNAKEAAAVKNALRGANIGFRHWYGPGLHLEPYFRTVKRDNSPNTELIGQTLIGLPIAPDLSPNIVEKIVSTLATALNDFKDKNT
jgi:dTDP-4-amino-4,6-dideoxygalactose transaminase